MHAWMLLLLAARDLGRQRRRTAAAIAILVIGATAVLLTRGWQRGMLEQIAHEGASVWLGAAQVHPADNLAVRDAFALTPNVALTPALLDELGGTSGVTTVSPRIRFLARLFRGDGSAPSGADEGDIGGAPCFVLASDMATAPRVVPRMLSMDRIEQGRLATAEDEILVAAPLAAALGIKAGDTATILARPVDGGLEGVDVKVVGIVRAAFEENQRRAVIVDLRLAQRLLRMEGRATEVLLDVVPLERAPEVAAALSARLATTGLGASSWEQINPRYMAARKIWATSLGVMLVVVVMVAALGISTSLHLIVRERGRDVATLGALGVPRGALLAMFILEGAVLGAVGSAIGCLAGGGLVGFLGARGVAFLPPGGFLLHVRPHLAGDDLAAAVVVGTVMSACVMAGPAWRAARRNPSELLR